MNTNLMTIDNMMFAGTAVAAPPASRPNAIKKTAQFHPTAEDTPPSANTPESTTTDNTPPITQNEPINKPTQDFHHTLRKTATTEAPRQDQNNTKPEKQQDSPPAIPPKANPTRPLSAPEIPITLGALVKEAATNMEPKDGRKLAQLIANLKDGKSTPVTGQAATVTGQATKSAEIKSLLTADDKGQLGLKTVLPEKSKGQTGLKTTSPETSKGQPGPKTVLPDTSNGQPGPKTVLPDTSNDQPGLQTVLSNTSEATPTADAQPGQNENTDKMPISNGTAIPTKAPTNGENVKELMPDALADDDSKTTTTGEKTTPVHTSAVANNSPKTPVLSDKKLTPQIPVDNASKITTTDEKAATTDKPATPVNQKTPALNTNFPPVQAKSPEVQSQPVVIAPEKPVPIAEQASDSNAAAPQILSESSSGGNSKESPLAGNKLSDNPTIQELNVTDVQVSAGQTKDRGGSTSNNSSNSNIEQILSHNNPQTPVTEQSSTSTEGAKTAEPPGQTSPSSASADIGKQILESIQSSLSPQRENQQITVRLNPPELGKVFIKFQEQDGQIIGLLEVGRQQTRVEIQQALPQIIQNLQGSGIQVKRVEVVLSEADQPEQEALKDQSPQNGWAQQQDSPNPHAWGNSPNTSGINEWLINNNSYQNISELQETLITDGINMLA